MNKTFTLIAVFLMLSLTNYLNGQDTLKPIGNRWGTELNFNPFNGSFSLNNANAQIKLRKFVSSNSAYRLAFTLNYLQDNTKSDNPYGNVSVHDQMIKKSMLFSVNVGREKHLTGSRRISPYIGFDVGFGIKSSSASTRSVNGSRKIKGAWEQFEYVGGGQYPHYITYFAERGYFSIGASAVTGIDLYIMKDFYLGYELSVGLDYLHYSNIKIDDGNDQGTITYPDRDDESWKFGPRLLNGIRIGYIF